LVEAKKGVSEAKSVLLEYDQKILQLEKRKAMADHVRKENKAVLNRAEITEPALGEIIPVLVQQRVHLMIDLAGIEARKRAIRNLIEGKKSEKNDPFTKRSLMLIELRNKQLERAHALRKRNAVTETHVQEAHIKLLDAEIQFQKGKREMQGAIEYGRMLREVALEEAEKTARKNVIEKMVKQYLGAAEAAKLLKKAEIRFENSSKEYEHYIECRQKTRKTLQEQMKNLTSIEKQIAEIRKNQ